MATNISDDELNMLSETERAALEDDTAATAEAEAAAAAAAAGGTDEDEGNAGGADENGGDAEAAAAAAAAAGDTPSADENAAAAEGDDGAAAAAAEDDRDEPFLPRYVADPVADYKGAMAALDKKFEDAEITLAEYNTQRDTLIRAQTKAEIAAEQNEQLAQQRWDWEVKHFIKDIRRNEDIDYDKPLLGAALDTAVKALANLKDAQGNLVHADKDGDWFLAEAHKQVKAEFGLGKKATVTPIVPNGEKPPKPRAVPTTLAGIPAAEIQSTGDTDPFASIDKLFADGRTEEAEMKLAGLSKADQQRYLRAS